MRLTSYSILFSATSSSSTFFSNCRIVWRIPCLAAAEERAYSSRCAASCSMSRLCCLTRSCHSLDEIVRYKQEYDYLFLSPIFDSISKVGYTSQFSHDELLRASSMGIIDSRVVALGGVTPDKIAYLEQLGFGGAAMCGAIYRVEALDSVEYLY